MLRVLKSLSVLAMLIGPLPALAQLVDMGFVNGWNIMKDPSLGNGCLIQTVYEDKSLVRIGYDGENNRGYFTVFNKNWGQVEAGKSYPVSFSLDDQKFDVTAIGFEQNGVPGGTVFFTDRAFVDSIAQARNMVVRNPQGAQVMAIDLSGSAKALDYARRCQAGN
ncbi:hypothetical protein ACFORG_05505 [Lutimaribacter marinistellae]|uniref:Uncharacterized protein n=1 Tax=Lutimaribacter marinistellae TaxID=1820329 RepID=A0ABV7THC7_9RHOB